MFRLVATSSCSALAPHELTDCCLRCLPAAVGDADILNFALTLEHLEAAFYGQALANFTADDFSKAGFSGVYPLLQQVSVRSDIRFYSRSWS